MSKQLKQDNPSRSVPYSNPFPPPTPSSSPAPAPTDKEKPPKKQ